MELTRRDALAALGATGIAVTGGAALLDSLESGDSADSLSDDDIDTLVAVAEVVYPSELSGVREFVATYSVGRTEGRQEYRQGLIDSVATLTDYATEWHDGRYSTLNAATRDTLLRQMGVAEATPTADGTDAERVRYYLVNDLLFALFSSPTGGKLAGIENPQGHPGGLESYRRGPKE
ncbi:gluconate 2-dehydrogenase subunit 3 family protein [Haladaptatus caseinilyticus]|uniref:gluconate 2-dehydrogenase subunit 3 family protein n=1 Tax=Haladaptatus caseinilyticus TaxID=2993314 RepID=UPI00224B3876|nr:gluconate 2-dehydrogenase subunit 3 family protein [Haladaptatus caseinilyticus]